MPVTISLREWKESPIEQGSQETIAYRFDASVWGDSGSYSGAACTIEDEAGADMTATCLTGAAAIDGAGVFTTPYVHTLIAGKRYRLHCKWVRNLNTFESFANLTCLF